MKTQKKAAYPFARTARRTKKRTDCHTGLRRKALVHALALGAGALAALPGPPHLAPEMTFLSYTGLVCLIPTAFPPPLQSLLPLAAGLGLCILWLSGGVCIATSLYFSGLLAFALRAVMVRATPRRQWLFLLLLICGFIVHITKLSGGNTPGDAPPYWTLPLFFTVGLAARSVSAFLKGDGEQRARLSRAALRLEKKLENGTLPPSFTHPVRQLLDLGRAMAAAPSRLNGKTLPLTQSFERLTEDLVRLGRHFGARKKRLLTDELTQLNIALHTRLKGHAPTEHEIAQDALKEHDRSAADLWRKARSMPKDVQAHVLGICDASDNILRCLRNENNNLPLANRFLTRYLKAAHLVLDRHSRLLEQGPKHQNIAKVLDRSKAVLANLESNFVREHIRLMHRDAADFSAELNTLDTLMRMDGTQAPAAHGAGQNHAAAPQNADSASPPARPEHTPFAQP